jgi:hypothetical protein
MRLVAYHGKLQIHNRERDGDQTARYSRLIYQSFPRLGKTQNLRARSFSEDCWGLPFLDHLYPAFLHSFVP